MADHPPPATDFELPTDVGPRISAPSPPLPFDLWQARIRQLRQWFPDAIPTAEERWRAKVHVEFHLDPPTAAAEVSSFPRTSGANDRVP